MLDSIKQTMRPVQPGESRELGFLERSECSGKGMFFHLKTATQVFKLSVSPAKQPQIRGYTREIEGLQFGCNMKAVEVPVVFTFAGNADQKAKTAGELIALEFVPQGFVLE
jgi:hypothetical protein